MDTRDLQWAEKSKNIRENVGRPQTTQLNNNLNQGFKVFQAKDPKLMEGDPLIMNIVWNSVLSNCSYSV